MLPPSRASKEPACDSAAPSLVSPISLLQRGRRGAVPAPHPHRLGQHKMSKLCELAGLLAAGAPVSRRHCHRGTPANTNVFPNRCQSRQHQVCCSTSPGAAITPITASPKILHLESATGRASREAVCFTSSIIGSPGSRERMGTQWYTSVLGQHYTSFVLL